MATSAVGRARTSSKSRIADEIVRLLSLWRARGAHRRLLAELAALDDHTLRDIGIDCADLHLASFEAFLARMTTRSPLKGASSLISIPAAAVGTAVGLGLFNRVDDTLAA